MNATTIQPAPTANNERHLWLPPTRLRQYVRARLLGAIGMAAIFTFWLVLQWSNPAMRYASMALIGVTAWITWVSIAGDVRRSRSRQVEVVCDLAACGLARDDANSHETKSLHITSPTGDARFHIADVKDAQWREDTDAAAGLWLYDVSGKSLAHLDLNYIGDQDEARLFLRWPRQRADLTFDVRWPAT